MLLENIVENRNSKTIIYYTISNVVRVRHLVGEYRAIKWDIIPPSLLYNKHVRAQETKTDQLGNSIRFAPVTRTGKQ